MSVMLYSMFCVCADLLIITMTGHFIPIANLPIKLYKGETIALFRKYMYKENVCKKTMQCRVSLNKLCPYQKLNNTLDFHLDFLEFIEDTLCAFLISLTSKGLVMWNSPYYASQAFIIPMMGAISKGRQSISYYWKMWQCIQGKLFNQ